MSGKQSMMIMKWVLIITDQTRTETEASLVQLETQIAQFREKKFGTNGELFQKQDELLTCTK